MSVLRPLVPVEFIDECPHDMYRTYTSIEDCYDCEYFDGQIVSGDVKYVQCNHGCSRDDLDESMDGDTASALTSAGFGTDEDYGYYGGDIE